jgi:hypothetical protein
MAWVCQILEMVIRRGQKDAISDHRSRSPGKRSMTVRQEALGTGYFSSELAS